VAASKDPGKPVAITWNDSKLDALAAEMATHVDISITPPLSGCTVLVSPGSTKLDRQFVKDTIKGLDASKPNRYTLKTSTVAAKTRDCVAATTGGKGVVYLTYDDGMAYADIIMNYARQYNIKVTFFEIGSLADRDAALLRRAIAEGHSVQSHGYIHAIYDYGTGHNYTWQYNDIKQSIDVITGITGVRPTYFRPPGGNRTADTKAAATANGVKQILWDLSSNDTSNNTTADICHNVVTKASSGDSVLMHSSKLKTANALPCIAQGLAAKGYTMDALR
jgi:peptidoglycan/xylan/chitin deacetylase (PgdA/CDA1 family)